MERRRQGNEAAGWASCAWAYKGGGKGTVRIKVIIFLYKFPKFFHAQTERTALLQHPWDL